VNVRPCRTPSLLVGIALACAFAPAPAAAADAPSGAAWDGALHLDDALHLAHADNWDLLAARSQVTLAEAGERIAREHPDPSLLLTTSHVHAEGGDATGLGNDLWSRAYDSVAQLGQELEIGGRRRDREQSARSVATAARARLADQRRLLDAAVVRAYVGAALADANARIAGESAGYLRDEARIATVRLEAGDISRSDRDQIEIAAAERELEAGNARADATAQTVALETMLGLTAGRGGVTLADSLETLAERAAPGASPGPGGARPDLAAARADLARAESDLRLQRALRIPDPTIVVQAEHQPPDRANTLGAGLSFPLPFWNRNAGEIDAARAARDQAARDVHRIAAQVAADTASARVRYEEAWQRWRRYRDDLRPRSEEIRRTVTLAYERGGASLLDLLEAQRSDNDVRLETMRAASDAAIAAADLEAATTAFEPESVTP